MIGEVLKAKWQWLVVGVVAVVTMGLAGYVIFAVARSGRPFLPSRSIIKTNPAVDTTETKAAPITSGPTSANSEVTAGLQTLTLTTRAHGEIQSFYRHPAPGTKRPAAIYSHGIIVEQSGLGGAQAKGYEVTDFVNALADAGWAAIAPIRPATVENDDALAAARTYLAQQANVDSTRIFSIGFSRGGKLALEDAGQASAGLAGLVLLAPAIASESDWQAAQAVAKKLTIPVFIALGAREPNAQIKRYVSALVELLQKEGKNVEARLNYPGNHAWFYEVRPEYWEDILAFLKSV